MPALAQSRTFARKGTACLLNRFVPAGRSSNVYSRIAQRNFNLTVQSSRLEGEARRAAELSRNAALDQLGAEAPLRRIGNRGTTLLAPVNAQDRTGIVAAHRLPLNLNAPTRHRQCPIFPPLRRELMPGHGQR